MQNLDKHTQQAWVHLLRASEQVQCAVRSALTAADLPALDWYDVLLELKRVQTKGLRQFELQEKLLIKQYNLSRLLKRMVDEGLLSQDTCNHDGRSIWFCLTQKGREMQELMWPVYEKALVTNVASKLTTEEAQTLSALLQKIRTG